MVKIFDTTLRDGEQSPGCSMNLNEKIQMAKQLERMNVDLIEAGFARASKGDFEAIQAIAREIKGCTIVSLARSLEKDIDVAWEAVKEAEKPGLHVFLATSDIHLEYKLKMTREEAKAQAVKAVKYGKKYFDNIEFSCEDATRTDWDFLVEMYSAVIEAGATTINIPDTVGYTTPEEFYKLVKYLMDNVKGVEDVIVSVHCHDDLGMAVANSLAAVRAGASQVECTVNGIGERAGNAAMEEVVMALKTRKDTYGVETNIETTEIMRASKLLQSITGAKIQANKAIVGDNAFAHESGIHQHGVLQNKETYEIMTPESVGLTENVMVLGKHSGKHALKDRVEYLGYSVSDEELEDLFVKFKTLADEKKTVYDEDIIALVLAEMSNIVEEGYELEDYSTSTSEGKESKTIIKVKKPNGEPTEVMGSGKGPIDAAFNALEKIFGEGIVLEDFSIYSITEGKDALGETKLELSKDGRKFTGKGVSNDIVKSSIYAYINAVNHMEYFFDRLKPQGSAINEKGI